MLDSADALFDGKGCEAGHRLVELLNSMCCARKHLRLLLTSEQSLLRETNIRFRNGTEKVSEEGMGVVYKQALTKKEEGGSRPAQTSLGGPRTLSPTPLCTILTRLSTTAIAGSVGRNGGGKPRGQKSPCLCLEC